IIFTFSTTIRTPPRSPLFPYTTLFRSSAAIAPPPRIAKAACRPAVGFPPTPAVAAHPVGSLRQEPPMRSGALRHSVHAPAPHSRSEEHTSELQSPCNLVCRLLLEKKKY